MARKHTEEEVLKSLKKKNDITIDGNEIFIMPDKVYNSKSGEIETNPKKKFDLGNGSWGKIDFLVHHCGYRIYQ